MPRAGECLRNRHNANNTTATTLFFVAHELSRHTGGFSERETSHRLMRVANVNPVIQWFLHAAITADRCARHTESWETAPMTRWRLVFTDTFGTENR